MLLAYERSVVFSAMLIPFLGQIPIIIVYYAKPQIMEDKMWGPFFKYCIGGFILPGLLQWAYIFAGALIFEALEMTVEEDAHPEFTVCLEANFTRSECREWRPIPQADPGQEAPEIPADLAILHAALGDPLSFPWRNFDMKFFDTEQFKLLGNRLGAAESFEEGRSPGARPVKSPSAKSPSKKLARAASRSDMPIVQVTMPTKQAMD